MMDSVDLSIFSSRINAVCEEMGVVLKRAAFSPNIKDRLDFSCAVFDAQGFLCAQAAHIPVHLGSMAYAMGSIINAMEWRPGDMVIVNDPFLGGTHLPDVTVIAPFFLGTDLIGFAANRAHHADIGASTPGSMPLSTTLFEEGVVIPPTRFMVNNTIDSAVWEKLFSAMGHTRESKGDINAQISANRCALERLAALLKDYGQNVFCSGLDQLNDYAEVLARAALTDIPTGVYQFTDYLDDDGQGNEDISICCKLSVQDHEVNVDFTGTAAQVAGNINCPLSVAAAGVYYVFRCLMPAYTPACAGTFRPISISAPEGCLLNALRPAAVAAGNVETSMRIVDTVLGALAQAIPERIPAASQGTMNNLAMGHKGKDRSWSYYETMAGGMGAGAKGGGLSAVHTHMTNTLNTPIESLEMHYPLRVTRYSIRRGSGGRGKRAGGDGLVREYEFLQGATVSLLTERRRFQPWGVFGGEAGACGRNLLNGKEVGGKVCLEVKAGDVLTVETPGGGGWGEVE